MTTASPRAALSALLLSGCLIGNGVPAQEMRSVGSYSTVATIDAVDIHLSTELAPDELRVRCDDNLIDALETRVDGNKLVVEFPGNMGVSPKATCEVTTGRLGIRGLHSSGSGDISGTGPFFAISEIHTSGSGDVSVKLRAPAEGDEEPLVEDEDDGFVDGGEDESLVADEETEEQSTPSYADRVNISTSGSGDLHLGGIDATRVQVRTTGSGDVSVAGIADRLDARSSGSGDISAKGLEVLRAEVRTSGSGDVRVTATESIEARSSGSGDITVWGSPDKRQKSSSGSGDIRIH